MGKNTGKALLDDILPFKSMVLGCRCNDRGPFLFSSLFTLWKSSFLSAMFSFSGTSVLPGTYITSLDLSNHLFRYLSLNNCAIISPLLDHGFMRMWSPLYSPCLAKGLVLSGALQIVVD